MRQLYQFIFPPPPPTPHPPLFACEYAARRGFVTCPGANFARMVRYGPRKDPGWSPKEEILLEGCDFEHWLVVVDKPKGNPTRDEIIDSYIKLLARVVGSEEEARMKLYSVSTRCYYAFGALVPEELSYKLRQLEGVRWVIPDSYLDPKKKDYGGEPFINGQAVPYDPKYHKEWERHARLEARGGNYDSTGNSGIPTVQSKAAAGKDSLKLSSYYVLSRWTKEEQMFEVHDTLIEEQAISHEEQAISQNLKGFLQCMQAAGSDSKKLAVINQKIQIALKEVQDLAGDVSESKLESSTGSSAPEIIDIHPPNQCDTKGSRERLTGGKEKAMEQQGKRPRRCRACGETAYHDSRNCPTKH